jgi:hypothetical protein
MCIFPVSKGGQMKNKLVLLFVLAAFMAACAPALRVYHFRGAPGFPPTRPEAVDLLRFEPQRPHMAFAEIRYDPPARANRYEVEWRLRNKGARIGADALVIEVDTLYRESVLSGLYRSYRGRRVHRVVERDHIIVAIAIRYR